MKRTWIYNATIVNEGLKFAVLLSLKMILSVKCYKEKFALLYLAMPKSTPAVVTSSLEL